MGRWWVISICVFFSAAVFGQTVDTKCHDNLYADIIKLTVQSSLDAFAKNKINLPFDSVIINPTQPIQDNQLVVELISNNGPQCQSQVPLGVCSVSKRESNKIKCDAQALTIFSPLTRPNPSLLYLFAHEIGHIHQRQSGTFTPQLSSINLGDSVPNRIKTIKNGCDRLLYRSQVKQENEADDLALLVLKSLLLSAPYSEPTFSERGALYWNLDLIRMVAEKLKNVSFQSHENSEMNIHPVFDPNTVPRLSTEPDNQYIEWSSHRFLCDVTTQEIGNITYPLRQSTHPSAESRMKKIADRLSEHAETLPGIADYPDRQSTLSAIAMLQEKVSPIFSFMDQRFGEYFSQVHAAVCTNVNKGIDRINCQDIPNHPPKPAQVCDAFTAEFAKKAMENFETPIGIVQPESTTTVLGQVISAMQLATGELLIGQTSPNRLWYISDKKELTNYPLPCSPTVISATQKGPIILCEKPFGIIEFNKNDNTFWEYQTGSFGGQSGGLNSNNIKPLWMGYNNNKGVIASVRLPSGNSISFQFSNGRAETLVPWVKDDACHSLVAGLGVWQFEEKGQYIGTTIAPEGTLLKVTLDPFLSKFDSVIDIENVEIADDFDFDTFEAPPIVVNCGPSFQHNEIVCINENGSIFIKGENSVNTQIVNIPLPDNLHTISICGTSNALYGLTTADGGFGETQFFRILQNGQVKEIFRDEVTNGGTLACQRHAAVGTINLWENSIIVVRP
jgi:hypothetical protein